MVSSYAGSAKGFALAPARVCDERGRPFPQPSFTALRAGRVIPLGLSRPCGCYPTLAGRQGCLHATLSPRLSRWQFSGHPFLLRLCLKLPKNRGTRRREAAQACLTASVVSQSTRQTGALAQGRSRCPARASKLALCGRARRGCVNGGRSAPAFFLGFARPSCEGQSPKKRFF